MTCCAEDATPGVIQTVNENRKDPFLQWRQRSAKWRLTQDCSRFKLTMPLKGREEYQLIETIGRETANVHLGSKRGVARVSGFGQQTPGWLHAAARAIFPATTEDWHQSWRQVLSGAGLFVRTVAPSDNQIKSHRTP